MKPRFSERSFFIFCYRFQIMTAVGCSIYPSSYLSLTLLIISKDGNKKTLHSGKFHFYKTKGN